MAPASSNLLLELLRDLVSADEPARQRALAEARRLLSSLDDETARYRTPEAGSRPTDWAGDPPLWEHQGRPLTVGDLRFVWGEVRADVPVMVSVYDSAGDQRMLGPVEIGLAGEGAQPEMVLITAA